MTDMTDPRELRLHFEGMPTHEHTLPADVLVKAIQQFQKVIHLLALAEDGHEVRQRMRISQEIENRFPLICHVPQNGGYAQPVEIGKVGHHLFDFQKIEELSVKTQKVIESINAGDERKLQELVPIPYYRSGVIQAFEAMQPPARTGIVLHLENKQHRKLLDGAVARERISQLKSKPVTQMATAPGYIVGSLIEMKFHERRLKLQLLTGKALDATYSEDFEPILLEHPRELIQVHGNILYGDNDSPLSISDVDSILEINEDSIEVAAIAVDGRTIPSKAPVTFSVAFNKEDSIYELEGEFGVILAAVTRPELEKLLDDELAVLWKEIALAAPESLTHDAMELRLKLLEVFGE